MEGKDIIKVSNLSKIFGDAPTRALDYLDSDLTRDEIAAKTGQIVGLRKATFSIKQSEIFVIMGLSGSGKSTLLRCLNRLQDPTFGEITIDGQEITGMNQDALRQVRRAKMGMVFQHFALLPHRTVLENVCFGLEIQGVEKEKRHAEGRKVLKSVGLEGREDSLPSELSGGMQQRVGLARGLAINPAILLMDEPFSALDPLIRTQMQDELLHLQQQMNVTIVFVTHDLNEAIRVGSRIAILDKNGRIVQIDTPEQILLHPANDYVESFIADVDRPAAIRVETVMKPTYVLQSAGDQSNTLRPYHTLKEALPFLLRRDGPVAVTDDNGKVVGELSKSAAADMLGL